MAVARIGEAALQLLRYGAGEARLTGAMRVDGILRGLGGLYAGTFTTTQRNAIASGLAPGGIIINNLTTGQLEWNAGSDASRNWQPIGLNNLGQLALNDVFIKRLSANAIQIDGVAKLGRDFTTAGRDAISTGSRPKGAVIFNTDTNQYETNKGTDAVPDWEALAPTEPIITNISAAGPVVDGKLFAVRAGGDYIILVGDATLNKWVGVEQYRGFMGLQTSGIPVGGPNAREPLLSLPWRALDSAGLKPQFRVTAGLMTTAGFGIGTTTLDLAYSGGDYGGAMGSLIAVTGSAITATSLTEVRRDSGWKDIPAGYVVKDILDVWWRSTLTGTTNNGMTVKGLQIYTRWISQ